jgi:hypothetical protein
LSCFPVVVPLTYQYAVQLLGTRAINLPEPFVALFHCLSGGMPRDLLRTARAAATQTSPHRPCALSEIAAYLVARDHDRGVADGDLGGHARFRHTVLQVFNDGFTIDDLHRGADPAFAGSFDALAAVHRSLTDPAAPSTDIDAIRLAWRLGASAPSPNGPGRTPAEP